MSAELKARGFGVSEFARLTGTYPATISNVLNGNRHPGDDLCRAIAGALNIPQWDVFMRAGLLTEKPNGLGERYYEIERLADRIQAMPEDERAEMMQLLEQIIAMSERRRKARDG